MSETAPEAATTPQTPAAPAAPAAPAVETPTPTPAAPPVPQPPAEQPPATAAAVDELPSWAQRELRDVRAEAAANRVRAKEVADALTKFQSDQEQQRQAMAKALGLVTDEPPTPEQLTEQLNAARSEHAAEQERARQAAVELAVFRAAAAAQVDGNALLDSRTFVSALDGLDPSAGDFAQRVTEAITTATESNPRYRVTPPEPAAPQPPAPPAVPRSGAEFGAAPSGPRQWTEEDVARSAPSDLQKAINEGLLENLGFGPRRAARR